MKAAGWVLVGYEPAYRLAPVVLGRESCGEFAIGAGELLDPPRQLTVTMSKASEAKAAADELVAPILSHALDYVRAHASVEGLIESARSDPELIHQEAEQVPLLLAAAGRHAEAREALTRYLAIPDGPATDPDYRRFARQLRLWMHAGGILPEPPTGPVRPNPDWSSRKPQSWRAMRQRSRARREAFDSVRHRGAGKSRDELRAMLRAEYERRGVGFSQLSIEVSVEAIERRRTPLGSATTSVQGVAAAAVQTWLMVGRIVSVVKLIRGEGVPDLQEPASWLEPPEEAAYRVVADREGDRWMTVELDDSAAEFLERAHAAARPVLGGPEILRPIDTALLDAWLAWDTTPPSANSRLVVHIGDQAVGVLAPRDAERYTDVMTAAARRHEFPRMSATLTTFDREPHQLLEIRAPRER